MAVQQEVTPVVRRRIAVLRAELAGATGRVRQLEAVLSERDREAAFLRRWAEESERHALSEVDARERLRTELEEIRGQLATIQRSFAMRAIRLARRMARLGR